MNKYFLYLAAVITLLMGACDREVLVTGVTINQTTASMFVGSTLTLQAIIEPANATKKNVTWSSYDDRVATVNTAGEVFAKTSGIAMIIVTTADGRFTATCTVTVEDKPKEPAADITLNPASLSFGVLETGMSEARQITIKNTGDAQLEITSVTSSDPAFTVSTATATLIPNEEKIVNVTFSPTQERSYSGTLTIQSNATEKTKTVVLTGRGMAQTVISILNPSVETGDSNNTLPLGWSTNSWGSITAQFTYQLNEGHTGNRSIRVDVTAYAEGDAKWMFEPVQLEPGKDYIFSNWYKSNVDTEVILAVTNTEGVVEYYDLSFAPKSETWTKYEAPFTMPKNGVKVSVYHVIKQIGWLITDDYQIAHYYYEGFNRGMVTITFDDGWEENPETVLPVMKQYGFKSTQYYTTTFIKDEPWQPHPWAKNRIQLFIDDGHEIGSHSVTHPFLTTVTEQKLIQELAESKQYLESFFGVPIRHFATPYGIYNTFVKDKAMEYYETHRTVDVGYNSKDNLDYSRLKNMCVLLTTTIDEFEEWVNKAKEENLWLIILYHRVGGQSALTINDTTPEKFAEQMQLIQNYGIDVVTISEALEKIK
jgi:peptidoglycan/xylan/chitin deacetylase (PgdA/CDA1 family)